jgi:hypothetical protein
MNLKGEHPLREALLKALVSKGPLAPSDAVRLPTIWPHLPASGDRNRAGVSSCSYHLKVLVQYKAAEVQGKRPHPAGVATVYAVTERGRELAGTEDRGQA